MCAGTVAGFIPGHHPLQVRAGNATLKALGRAGSIVVLRDPRKRLLSAFNYRRHTYVLDTLTWRCSMFTLAWLSGSTCGPSKSNST